MHQKSKYESIEFLTLPISRTFDLPGDPFGFFLSGFPDCGLDLSLNASSSSNRFYFYFFGSFDLSFFASVGLYGSDGSKLLVGFLLLLLGPAPPFGSAFASIPLLFNLSFGVLNVISFPLAFLFALLSASFVSKSSTYYDPTYETEFGPCALFSAPFSRLGFRFLFGLFASSGYFPF